MVKKFNIPADHPALSGHFPGNPVVPAVVLLDMTAELLSVAEGVRINSVGRLRLQKPVTPGVDVVVEWESGRDGAWPVRLLIDDSVVAKGMFSSDCTARGEARMTVGADVLYRDATDAYNVLPHALDMALLREVGMDGSGILSTGIRVSASHPLVANRALQPWAALEYAAQLYGCRGIIRAGDESAPPELMGSAYIVLVRAMTISDLRAIEGDDLRVSLRVLSEQGRAAQCEFEATVNGEIWSWGTFTVSGQAT